MDFAFWWQSGGHGNGRLASRGIASVGSLGGFASLDLDFHGTNDFCEAFGEGFLSCFEFIETGGHGVWRPSAFLPDGFIDAGVEVAFGALLPRHAGSPEDTGVPIELVGIGAVDIPLLMGAANFPGHGDDREAGVDGLLGTDIPRIHD